MTRANRRGPTRRDVLAAGAAAVGAAALSTAAGAGGLLACGDGGGGPGTPDADTTGVGDPELSAGLWQTMCAYARASADGSLGTRMHLYNPAPVASRVVIQIFRLDGTLISKEVWDALPGGHARHLELGEYLTGRGVALPFEGSLWIGTTPSSGDVFMGLQGISFDWYGPAHLASVHGMRDFGNSNHDTMWTDLVLPRAVGGSRWATRVAILNASGDGLAEALTAVPELIVRGDDGAVLAQLDLDPLPVHTTRLIDLRDVVGGGFERATVQIREPSAGLVAVGLVFDGDNDGIVSADHFFDRHFVVDSTGFTG